MKAFGTLILYALVGVASAQWSLVIQFEDGGDITSRGTVNSDCVMYSLAVEGRKVNEVFLNGNGFADTFELYESANCSGQVAFSGGEGPHEVEPAKLVRSYKVY